MRVELLRRPDPRAWGAICAFLLLTFLLAWIPVLAVRPFSLGRTGPWIARLLAASASYGATMGWQPLLSTVAVNRWFRCDTAGPAFRPTAGRFTVVAIALSLAVIVGSATVGWLGGWDSHVGSARIFTTAEPELVHAAPSLGFVALVVLAFVLTIALLYLQCFSEEYGWRGFFLTTLMRELGPRRGLFIHGGIWGLWYAPAFLLATSDTHHNAFRCVGFIFTCTLLGVMLGWLRLASKSIIPAVVANGFFTLACGLPFILQNTEVGLRGAAYTPLGWVPLAAIGIALMFGKWRRDIAIPSTSGTKSPILMLLHLSSGPDDHARVRSDRRDN
jgi:membrane protease YdiL (CAAX protease family)